MVELAPFAAVRYDVARLGRLDLVLAPPYDVIGPERRAALAAHPRNIVAIDLPEHGYPAAAATLAEWLRDGTLVRDSTPALYVLTQSFTGPDGVQRERAGFFARARLSSYEEGAILPHERTLRGPKVDRLELMRATAHNLSAVFVTYRDPTGDVSAALDATAERSPIASGTLDGVEERLWRLDDPAAVARVQAALAPLRLYIADGHHRYETALAYREERRAAAPRAARGLAGPGYESVLVLAAPMEDQVIFPTHRLVSRLPSFDEGSVLAALTPFFTVEGAPEAPQAATQALAAAGAKASAFLFVTGGASRLLVLRPDAPLDAVPSLPRAPELRHLDVTLLHAVIFEHILGIDAEAQATGTNLTYSKDARQAIEAPRTDPSVQAAFLLNPTRIEEVVAVAEAGLVMPQKSTFFYPKIPSGLVLYPLDDAG